MSKKKILFPTDFSSHSDAGLKFAAALARDMNCELEIVHVLEEPTIYAGEFYYGNVEPDGDAVLKMLHAVKPDDPEVPFRHQLLRGDAAKAICDHAGENEVDLIVMSTHGRTGLARLIMGSVAEYVVRKATCPVLTFRGEALQPDANVASAEV
ncbi:MAG: universal stress protein [Pirellulales bacterium]|nr:universal stress protein [Pirellulales bacterium]